jgi:hypothetical protein
VIDTGAATTLSLSAKVAGAAGLLTGRRIDRAPSITFGGLSQDQVVKVASVGFAGETWRDVPVHIYTPDLSAPLPPGLLGGGVGAFPRLYRSRARPAAPRPIGSLKVSPWRGRP